jgi:hypothetical protein
MLQDSRTNTERSLESKFRLLEASPLPDVTYTFSLCFPFRRQIKYRVEGWVRFENVT